MGRPLLLGVRENMQVQEYMKYLRQCGSPFNTAVVLHVAEGVIRCEDANLIACKGGGILLMKSWAKSFLHRMGMAKRRASSKAKVVVQHFYNLKEGFLLDIKNIMVVDEIPLPL